jgi:hypothetical protein
MAESIYGEDFNVHFTNGGGAALFEALISLGEKLPEEKIRRELLDYLQYSLDNFGYGCRFFNIENLPEQLNKFHLAEYGYLINLFCRELTKSETKLEVNMPWDLASRMSWLARLMNLYLFIEKQLAKNGVEIPAQNIPLSPDEAVTVERLRLLAVYDKSKQRLEKAERVKLFEKIVELTEQDKISSVSNELLNLTYFTLVELYDDDVSTEKQLSVYKKLLETEKKIGDPEMIGLIGEMIEGLAGETE